MESDKPLSAEEQLILDIEKCLLGDSDKDRCQCSEVVQAAFEKQREGVRRALAGYILKEAQSEEAKPDGYGWFVVYLEVLARKIRAGKCESA